MYSRHRSISNRTRALSAAIWGALCAAAIAAPYGASHSCHGVASAFYLLFSRICHQIPERSFSLFGFPLPVCHRCSGIYAGLFLGCFLVIRAVHDSPQVRRWLVLSSLCALGIDALAPLAGLWNSSAISRFSTGLFFGMMTSLLVVRGLEEFVQEFSWRRFVLRPAPLKGDLV
jgi:uncharacterized membrane protein